MCHHPIGYSLNIKCFPLTSILNGSPLGEGVIWRSGRSFRTSGIPREGELLGACFDSYACSRSLSVFPVCCEEPPCAHPPAVTMFYIRASPTPNHGQNCPKLGTKICLPSLRVSLGCFATVTGKAMMSLHKVFKKSCWINMGMN